MSAHPHGAMSGGLIHLVASAAFFLGAGTAFLLIALDTYPGPVLVLAGVSVIASLVINLRREWGRRFMARDVWESSLIAVGVAKEHAAWRLVLVAYFFVAGAAMFVVSIARSGAS